MTKYNRWNLINKDIPKNINEVVNIILENRNIKTKARKIEFLNPTSPLKISLKQLGVLSLDINLALKRIKKAVKNKEPILIYGDYDADGVCSTAVLWETLYELGANVTPYIPNRFRDGYGINTKTLSELAKKDYKLVITVDNGIVAHDAAKSLAKEKVDLIITDHHKQDKKLPEALAIIHTTQTSGSGIAWFFSKELSNAFKKNINITEKLSLAAIGTVADQLSLTEVNRSLVKYGIEELNTTTRIGLLNLYKAAKIDEVDTYHINYLIAPRINAAGRLEEGMDALRLLCTKSPSRAEELSLELSRLNFKRQGIVEDVVNSAVKNASQEKILVISGVGYHEGVIGIAASRLVEKFYRPAIVISTGEKISKASARSISGFSIIEAIRAVDDLILEGGGHTMAAGFSLETSNIDKFRQAINRTSDEILTEEILQPKLKIDSSIDFTLLNLDLEKSLSELKPFGIGNPTPTFLTKGCRIQDIKPVGENNKHLKMRLTKNDQVIDAIAFGIGDSYQEIVDSELLDIVYNLDKNTWNGKTSLQLKIKDVRRSGSKSV